MKLVIKHIFKLTLVALVVCSCSEKEKTQSQPNVIFVLADDLGYSELNSYGNTFNETPNLNGLTKKGLRFTNAYVSAPVCSPSRASLMTGQHPARIGITDYLRPHEDRHLDEGLTTIAEIFESKGYHTGMIGKWHLSGYAKNGAKESGPDKHGFKEVRLNERRGISGGSYFYPYHFNQEVQQKIFPTEHLTDRVNLETIEFLEKNNPQKTGKPFFLYKSHYSVHTNLNGKPDYVEAFSKKEDAGLSPLSNKNNVHLAAQLKSIDDGIGMIVNKLKEINQLENTIIVFMSDNGGETNVTNNAPLRAGKSTVYEGGFRVPLIVYWDKEIKESRVVNEAVSCMDFFSTFAELLEFDTSKSQIQDGKSMLALWRDNKTPDAFANNTLYWHYPLEAPHFLGGFSSGAIRKGDYKLVEDFTTKKTKLFNLNDDLGEVNDVSETHPKIQEELYNELKNWRSGLDLKASGHTKVRKKQPEFPDPYGPEINLDINGKVVPWINYGVTKTERGELVFGGERNFLNLLHLYIPDVTAKSVELSATVERDCANGVIIAHGEEVFGLAVYIKDDKLYYSTRKYGVLKSLLSDKLPKKFHFKAVLLKNGDMKLFLDNKLVAETNIGESLPIPPDDPTSIGTDFRRLIGEYEAENYFKGKISNIKFKIPEN